MGSSSSSRGGSQLNTITRHATHRMERFLRIPKPVHRINSLSQSARRQPLHPPKIPSSSPVHRPEKYPQTYSPPAPTSAAPQPTTSTLPYAPRTDPPPPPRTPDGAPSRNAGCGARRARPAPRTVPPDPRRDTSPLRSTFAGMENLRMACRTEPSSRGSDASSCCQVEFEGVLTGVWDEWLRTIGLGRTLGSLQEVHDLGCGADGLLSGTVHG